MFSFSPLEFASVPVPDLGISFSCRILIVRDLVAVIIGPAPNLESEPIESLAYGTLSKAELFRFIDG
jgi:hypothetical protein